MSLDNPGSNKAMDQLDAIAGEFDNASPVLRKLYDTVRSERLGEIDNLSATLAEQEKKTNELEAIIAQEQQSRKDIEETVAREKEALSTQLKEKEAIFAAERNKVHELESQLDAGRRNLQNIQDNFAHAEQLNNAFRNSTSWKMTRPLRNIVKLIKKKR